MTSATSIESFLAEPRIALVGVSRDPKQFSHGVMRELVAQSYDVVPVNQRAVDGERVLGRAAYRRLSDVPAPPRAALIMTPASEAAAVTRDALAAGATKLWFHRGAGPGSATPEALELARAAAVEVTSGECPLMYLPNASLVHRVHAGLRQLAGRAPHRGPFAPRPGAGLVTLLVGLLAVIAVSASIGGAALVQEPSGARLGLTPGALIRSPFTSFLFPGLGLVALGVLHGLTAVLALRRRAAAGPAAIVVGSMLALLILMELLWLEGVSWLQPAMLVIGVAEVVLGLRWLAITSLRVPALDAGERSRPSDGALPPGARS